MNGIRLMGAGVIFREMFGEIRDRLRRGAAQGSTGIRPRPRDNVGDLATLIGIWISHISRNNVKYTHLGLIAARQSPSICLLAASAWSDEQEESGCLQL
jgi:hypothetical protein